MKTHKRENENRDSILLILLILIFGFFLIIVASGWAVRLAPNWKLPANMGSNLNPDSQYSPPISAIQPIDPAILNTPLWYNSFLTPNAFTLPSQTPKPIDTNTPIIQPSVNPATSTITLTPIITITVPPIITKTSITIVPGPTRTDTPSPQPQDTGTPSSTSTPTSTFTPSSTPLPAANLRITKNDGFTTYLPSGVLMYTIVARNNGPSAVTGAIITDNIPAQITDWTWVCLSQNGGATGCNGIAGSTANFSDTVNLPNGASIVYTVIANISSIASGNLINTANINVPAGYVDPVPGNNSATDTNTPVTADLQITKDDSATDYEAGGQTTYTIIVSNNGPDAVTGATITDNIPTQIQDWTWTCSSQTGGATGCDGITNSAANFTDTVDLPNGASITYTVTATISAGASGALANTVSVNAPAGYTDPTGNNSDTDTNQLITSNCFPYFNIGTSSDSASTTIPTNGFLTLRFCSPPSLVVGSHAGYDLVYYPDPTAPTLEMDMVIIQIGNGSNWYTIFNWGNGSPDSNTDINPADCPTETDQCVITPPSTNPPGISIDLDAPSLNLPAGAYTYIRIISLPDSGDGVSIDAISILP